MSELSVKILEAALQVFMRYGVERTRMSDIAEESGVVRQTLYSFFNSKDDILCASIRHFSESSLAEIKREWASCDSLDDKIDVFFEHAIVDSYLMISASPDARDMIGGFNAKGRAEIERVQIDKIKAWSETLEMHMPSPNRREISSDELAEFVVLGSLGLRDQAFDEQQLRRLLNIQKLGILALAA